MFAQFWVDSYINIKLIHAMNCWSLFKESIWNMVIEKNWAINLFLGVLYFRYIFMINVRLYPEKIVWIHVDRVQFIYTEA